MTNEQREIKRKKRLLQYAERHGNVNVTCRRFGIAMLALPGPAVVVIPLGLGILALEFAWARHWLRRMKERTNS